MNIDDLIISAYEKESEKLNVSLDKHGEILKYIEEQASLKENQWLGFTKIQSLITKINFRGLIAVAAFVLILVVIPLAANYHSKSKSGSTEISNLTASLDPSSFNMDLSINNGDVVMVSTLNDNTKNDIKVYHVERLDNFIANFKEGKKDTIRVITYAKGPSGAWVNELSDLQYDGKNLVLIRYDVYSDKNKFIPSKPISFAKIVRTEDSQGITYSLCEKNDTPDYLGITLINFLPESIVSNDIQKSAVKKISQLTINLPKNWSYTIDQYDTAHIYANGEEIGGIALCPLYSNDSLKSLLPNHSSIVSEEDIEAPLGKCKLVVLEMQNPAASNIQKTWIEMHAVIPAYDPVSDDSQAYDIWLITKDKSIDSQSSFISLVKSIK